LRVAAPGLSRELIDLLPARPLGVSRSLIVSTRFFAFTFNLELLLAEFFRHALHTHLLRQVVSKTRVS
jgi:hypothetical protein